MFQTELDTSKKKAVHDELARLLVQYLRQTSTDEDHIPGLLVVSARKLVDWPVCWYYCGLKVCELVSELLYCLLKKKKKIVCDKVHICYRPV